MAAASLAAEGQSRIRAIMALCWFNHDEASDCHQPEWFVMPQPKFKWIPSPSRQLGSASHGPGDIGWHITDGGIRVAGAGSSDSLIVTVTLSH